MANRKLIAIVDMALRRSPNPGDPLFEEFDEWPAGTVFEPPKHLKVDMALERRIAAWADDPEGIAGAREYIEDLRREAARRTALLNELDEASAVQEEEARLAREAEEKVQRKADEKRTADYLKAYDRRRAAEERERAEEAEPSATTFTGHGGIRP